MSEETTEEYLYDEHPHMFRGNPLYFVGAVLLIPVGGIGLIILLFWWLYCKQTRVMLTREHVLIEKGILSKSRIELRHSSVRTVHIYQSFGQRIFGVGKLEIYTAGDNPEVTVNDVPNPHLIREIINEHGS